MTDPTLSALLADPDPAARLIAADRAADLGDELSELLLRVVALSPPDGGSWNCHLDGWDVCIYWGSMKAVFAYPFGEPQLSCAWAWWLANRSVKRGHAPRCCWTRFRVHKFAAAKTPPPPALEAAVLAVLRGRLEEMRLSS